MNIRGIKMNEINNSKVCRNCGESFDYEFEFCPKCGTKYKDSSSDLEFSETTVNNNNIFSKFSKKQLGAIIGIASTIVLIIIIFLIMAGTPTDFSKKYSEFNDVAWCDVDPSGEWISFDTNPYDFDSDDYPSLATMYMSDATDAIQEVLDDLNFSSAVYQKMLSTTWSQGIQSEENNKYVVSWSYHPEKGLEVMFENK
jgi:uncharacterized membrane protein YvbJ